MWRGRTCSTSEWREDLQLLAETLIAWHPNPFYSISRTRFERIVADLDRRVPHLSDGQIAFNLARLLAVISAKGRDGHTTLGFQGPGFQLPLQRYPLLLYWFHDGVFVIDGLGPSRDLKGMRVTRIGNRTISDALQLLDPIVSRDNAMHARAQLPWALTLAEFLQVAGVTTQQNRAEWQFETATGERHSLALEPVSGAEYWEWIASRSGRAVEDLTANPDPAALYLATGPEAFQLTLLKKQCALYVQYDAVRPQTASGERLTDFAARMLRLAREHRPARIVIDVRRNGGGDNRTYGPLLRALEAQAVDQQGSLFALIGRHTFSAAGNFVTELERLTEVLLIGEPTGGSPNQYGDARPLTLPNSGIVAWISTIYHEKSDPSDARLWVSPHIAVEPTTADHFAGYDRALVMALNYGVFGP